MSENFLPQQQQQSPFFLSHTTAENLYRNQVSFQPDSSCEFEFQGSAQWSSYNINSDNGDM